MISEHFTKKEITCKCGCGQAIIQEDLFRLMEIVREYCGGFPVDVHCVNRCKQHNKDVGGVSNSQHLRGAGMDCHIPELDMPEFHNLLIELYDSKVINDLGLYDWGAHIGIRSGRHFWDKRK